MVFDWPGAVSGGVKCPSASQVLRGLLLRPGSWQVFLNEAGSYGRNGLLSDVNKMQYHT